MKENSFKYRVFYGMIKGLAFLPLPVLYAVMAPVRFVLGNLLGYRKKVIHNNLVNAFPECNPKEIKKIEKQYYRHLCDLIAETVKEAHISDREMAERMKILNPEKLNEYINEGRPVVLMLGHLGNWEWIPQISVWLPKDGVRMGEVYKPLRDPVWGKMMWNLRNRWNNVVQIPQKKTVRTIIEWNREGPWVVGFISDQRPNNEDIEHKIKFFGRDIKAMVGAEGLGKKTGAAFLFVDVAKPKRGHYELTFREILPPEDSVSKYPVTEEYYRMLENAIRRDPAIYLWSHNRWKGN